MAHYAYMVKPDSEIFPCVYRREFTEAFLKQNPAALPYQVDVEESVQQWFKELEIALRNNYSAEERVLLRFEIMSRIDLGEIKRTLADILAQSCPKQDLVTSNQYYREIFEASLFLHKGNSQVCLRNLFVHFRFTEEYINSGEMLLSKDSMDAYLARFLQDSEKQFLFIEGDAGCGKSSLTAYLSYHYEQHDNIAAQIFGDVQLITVCLREINLPDSCKPEQRLKRSVLQFLYGQHEWDHLLEKRFLQSGSRVLLLDGYDELCTMVGIGDSDAILSRLRELDCKIIVTTRPDYINYAHFQNLYWHIALEHFDRTQRREWQEHYEQCGEMPNEINRQYLERIDNGETAEICDTPMGLYMVAAGHFTPDMLENEWEIYRQIFYTELSETKYNPDSFEAHSILEYREQLYQVSEEIAWYLYQRSNKSSLVPDGEITRIISNLGISDEKQKVIKHCFALCGYWKASAGSEFVEFYHSNIRDFFLCEKLARELKNAYCKFSFALQDNSEGITPFLNCICELFQYGKIEATVLSFLRQRAMYFLRRRMATFRDESDTLSDIMPDKNQMIQIFEQLLFTGDFYSVCSKRWKMENPIKTISCILSNIVAVYSYLYEPLRTFGEGERIQWWADVKVVNEDGTFRHLSEEILKEAGPLDLHNIDLHGVDLHGVDLHESDLRGANLQRANLRGANLQGADLSNADLRGVDFHGANLKKAILECVRSSGACFHEAVLSAANLLGADLRFANLREATLSGAYLRKAILCGADLRGADLRGADLVDAYLHGTLFDGH